jgi:hypothetical protein
MNAEAQGEKTMESKKQSIKNIDDYIDSFPINVQKILKELRSIKYPRSHSREI